MDDHGSDPYPPAYTAAATVPAAGAASPAGAASSTYGSNAGLAPPTYDRSATAADAPPSYDSLFGQVQKAKEESTGGFDLFKKLGLIVCGTLGCTIFVAIVLAIPITSIVLGSKNLHNCRVERFIPIYLIVAGVFGVIKGVSDLIQRLRQKVKERNGDDDSVPSKNPFDGIIGCFLFAWFIAGNVWIFGVRNDVSYNPASAHYCDRTMYLYAFWSTLAVYILLGLTCCCVCCIGIFAAKNSGNNPSNA